MKFDEIILWFAAFAAFLTCCFLATGCSTERCVPQIEYVRRDSIIMQQRTDSVTRYVRDSVYIDRRADTVFKTITKTIYQDRISLKTDTVTQYRDREIEKTRTVVERYVPPFHRFCTWFFWLVLVAALIWLLVKLYKRHCTNFTN